jgi:hypothetical protein
MHCLGLVMQMKDLILKHRIINEVVFCLGQTDLNDRHSD